MGSIERKPPHPVASDGDVVEAMRALAERVAELEARAAGETGRPRSLGFSDDKLATIASSFYRSRQMRARYFGGALLGEPAWDMLLDLFIHKVRGRRVATTSLCVAAKVAQATGLRWITALQQEGLLERAQADDDARLKLIELTPKAYKLMRRFIADSVTQFEMPLPD